MNGYESPFQLPEDQKCTAPKDARDYPALHAVDGESGHYRFPYTGKPCPVHNRKLRGENDEWHEWARWRSEYAKPDATDDSRQYALNSMLRYVTESNPPDIKQKTHRVQRRPSDGKLVAVSVISVILAVCMLTCFLAILL